MGSVNISLANGQLGASLQTNDGIAGMVLTGTTESGGYAENTPILITSLDDLANQGITETDNAFAYRQVREFYDEAGPATQLYLMLVASTMKIDDIANYTTTNSAKVLLDYAAGKIKLLGIMTNDAEVYSSAPPDTAHGINADVFNAATKMATLASNYFEAQKPFRAVIGGTSYSGTVGSLTDITAGSTNNRTSILIGDTESGSTACLGLLIGRLSSIPVQRKVSRVRTGSLSNTEAYIGTTSVESAGEDLTVIAQKGYITFKTYPNVSGYFFSGDDTCSATTDDYHFISRGRVIDKAHILTYATFVQEVDDEVPVNTDGTLDAGFCKWLSQQIVNQINNTMTSNKEISSVNCFIDPAQNILSTNQLNIVLRITPVGYATDIEISLGFENPAL